MKYREKRDISIHDSYCCQFTTKSIHDIKDVNSLPNGVNNEPKRPRLQPPILVKSEYEHEPKFSIWRANAVRKQSKKTSASEVWLATVDRVNSEEVRKESYAFLLNK